jgi:hypothetical protein
MSQDLKALKEQYKKLGDEIEKLEKEEKDIRIHVPTEDRQTYYSWNPERGKIDTYRTGFTSQLPINPAFSFQGESQAKAFLTAFEVMTELRRQPGIVEPQANRSQWIIQYDWMLHVLTVINTGSGNYNYVSPAYQSIADARHAMQVVGEERIRNAFRTLLFMTEASKARR